MPSTYTQNLGIEKIANGEQAGSWGTTTNLNFDFVDRAISGQVSVELSATGSTGSPNTLAISDGALSDGQYAAVTFTDAGDLGGTAYVQLDPNDAQRIIIITNSLSGSRDVVLFQGTYDAGRAVTLSNAGSAIIGFDGGGTTATTTNLLSTAALSGSTIDDSPIGATTPSTGAFTTLDASGATNLASTLDVDGATTLNSTLDVTGATTLSGTVALDGVTTASENIAIDGDGDFFTAQRGTASGEAGYKVLDENGVQRLNVQIDNTDNRGVLTWHNTLGTEQGRWNPYEGVINNATGSTYDFQINGTSEMTLSATQLDMQGNDLVNIGTASYTTLQQGGQRLAWEFIETQDASNDATLDFTSFDASKYDAYFFSVANLRPATDSNTGLWMRFSTNGGSSWISSNYRYANLCNNSCGVSFEIGSASASQIKFDNGLNGANSGEDGMSGEMWMHGPHLARRTTITYNGSQWSNSGSFSFHTGAGTNDTQTAVNGLRFFYATGNISSGTITMYGLRNG